jgi:flagellar FliL protein
VAFFLLTKFGILVPDSNKMMSKSDTNMTQPNGMQQESEEATQERLSRSLLADYDPILIDIPPFIVNLSGELGRRYLSVTMNMEVETEKDKSEVEKRLPLIRNRLIFLLSNKTFKDISSVEGKYELQDEISRHVNEVLGKQRIRKTMFTSFVVQ